MFTDIPDLVFQNPGLTIALTALVAFAVNYQRGLTYREFRFLHIAKCYAFSILNSRARKHGRPLVRTASDEDYVRTIDATPRTVARRITDEFSPHLVATAKRRWTRNGYEWSHSQWVFFHGDGDQTEAYLFSNPDGTTDVYAHVETSVTDPEGHIRNEQRHGDARNAFATVWGNG